MEMFRPSTAVAVASALETIQIRLCMDTTTILKVFILRMDISNPTTRLRQHLMEAMQLTSGVIQLTPVARIALLIEFKQPLNRTSVKLMASMDLEERPNFRVPFWRSMGKALQGTGILDMVNPRLQLAMAIHIKAMGPPPHHRTYLPKPVDQEFQSSWEVLQWLGILQGAAGYRQPLTQTNARVGSREDLARLRMLATVRQTVEGLEFLRGAFSANAVCLRKI